MPLSVGTEPDPFEILAPIGKGGMGPGWKARDTRSGRIAAIEVSGAQFSERFEREAKATAALNHPSIFEIYDVGPDYFVMEYVEGAPVSPPDTPRRLPDMAKAAQLEIRPDAVTRPVDQGGRRTNPGTTVGTIAYMSPEHTRGQANLTEQFDQFSLGLVLFEETARVVTERRISRFVYAAEKSL